MSERALPSPLIMYPLHASGFSYGFQHEVHALPKDVVPLLTFT